jgi:hypothetical protein
VTHRSDIHMRLRALELRLRHGFLSFVSVSCWLCGLAVAAIGIEPMTFRL